MIPMHHSQIGGGKVERPFTMGGRLLPRGTMLTRDEVLAIRTQNRTALIEKGQLSVYPKDVVTHLSAQTSVPQEHFVVNKGFGKYDVIAGRKVNQQPLDKESAYLLAGKPLPSNGEAH